MNKAAEPNITPKNATVVCVTDQFHCERLIMAGRRISNIFKTSLYVVNVTNKDVGQINTNAIEYLFKKSKENSAAMNIISCDDPVKAIIGFVKDSKAINVVTGLPGDNSHTLQYLWRRLKNVRCYTVSPEGEIMQVDRSSMVMV